MPDDLPTISPETLELIDRLKSEYGVGTNTEVLREALRRARMPDAPIPTATAEAVSPQSTIADVVTLMRRTPFDSDPSVSMSDDGLGIVTLLWREKGVAILLAGDGIASVSYSDGTRTYCDNSRDYPVDEPLPISVAALPHLASPAGDEARRAAVQDWDTAKLIDRLRSGEPCAGDVCKTMDARSGRFCAEAADKLVAVAAERDEARARIKYLEAIVADKLADTRLLDAGPRGGGFQFNLEGGPIPYIAEYLVQMMGMREGDPANYFEIEVQHHEFGSMTLSIQRRSGKTPHQFRLAAEAERDEAVRQRDTAIQDTLAGITPWIDCQDRMRAAEAERDVARRQVERMKLDRLKLDRRIHNQRKAWRDTWEIVESRRKWLGTVSARKFAMRYGQTVMQVNARIVQVTAERDALAERLREVERALDITVSRGCDHCADSIREARAIAQATAAPATGGQTP